MAKNAFIPVERGLTPTADTTLRADLGG